MAGGLRPHALGVPGDLLAVHFDHPSLASNLLREYPQSAHVGNQSSDGFGFGTTQFVCFAELQEERIRFVFTKVWMFVAQTPELFQYPVVPQTFAFCFRCTAPRIESLQLPVSFLEPPLPLPHRASSKMPVSSFCSLPLR